MKMEGIIFGILSEPIHTKKKAEVNMHKFIYYFVGRKFVMMRNLRKELQVHGIREVKYIAWNKSI